MDSFVPSLSWFVINGSILIRSLCHLGPQKVFTIIIGKKNVTFVCCMLLDLKTKSRLTGVVHLRKGLLPEIQLQLPMALLNDNQRTSIAPLSLAGLSEPTCRRNFDVPVSKYITADGPCWAAHRVVT